MQQEILNPIRNCLKQVLPVGSRAILFGSQARGDARSDSDWDILILVDKHRIDNDDFDEYAFPLVELGWQLDVAINPLIYSYADWHKRHFTPFYHSVEEEGILIWH